MRKVSILIIGLMILHQIPAQKLECIPESKQIFTDILVDNIILSCNDFMSINQPDESKHMIIHIDIKISNDTSILRMEDSYTFYGLLLKRPDAIIKIGDNLALIHSKNYKFANDSIWLKHVYNICKGTAYETSFEIVSWKRNIYKNVKYENPALKSKGFIVPDSYHRYGLNNYLFVKNKLISKSINNEIIYKYNFFPKNIDRPWMWEDKYYKKGLDGFVEIDSIK